jgi:multisubunit Na+/H+ antiporter MnhG subunit
MLRGYDGMGKEFVVERQRIERIRMSNRWFYVNSCIAVLGVLCLIAGATTGVLVAFLMIFALNLTLPMNTHFKLRGALARDRARERSQERATQ